MKLNALWWWIDRWRKSTAYTDMTLEEQGAYRNLLDEANLRGGALPNDERILAKASGDALAWSKVREKVMARFEAGADGCLHNVTLDEVIRESKRRAKKQADYRNKRGNAVGNSGGNSDGSPDPSPDPSPSPDQAPEKERSFSGSDKPSNGNGVPEDQRPAYADAVWTEFLRISEQPVTRLMSPGEYATVKGWMNAGVPLRVVLRGLADCGGKGRTLSYYAPAVSDAIASQRQAVPL